MTNSPEAGILSLDRGRTLGPPSPFVGRRGDAVGRGGGRCRKVDGRGGAGASGGVPRPEVEGLPKI